MDTEELELALSDSQEEIKRLEISNTKLEDENEELKYQLMHTNNNLDRLKQVKETLEDENEELIQKIKVLKKDKNKDL